MKENFEEKRAEFKGSLNSARTASLKNLIPDVVYENLPEPLKEICNNFRGREKDIVFISSIGVLSSCMPNVFGYYDSRKYNPNLYVFVIAPPASGKGVMSWSKKLVEPIHDDLVRESKRKLAEYNNNQNLENNPPPSFQIKIVPGNTSSAKFYSHLMSSTEDLIIFETEADSLSNMLKQDWGNFSDILRKGFHHETVSISRSIDDRFFEIKNPKLSIVLSGTPDQIRPLVESKDNGLFSRFIYYYFNEVTGWKDVSPNFERANYDELFKTKSREIKELYLKLKSKKSVEIRLTKRQWEIFQNRMSSASEIILNSNKLDFVPVLRRLGVIAFRIISILTVLERKTNLEEEFEEIILYAEDNHVSIAMDLIKILIEHSLEVFDMFEKNAIPLTMIERSLLLKLPDEFSRQEGHVIARSLNIPERTYDEFLRKWTTKNIIQKVSHGRYMKG